MIRKSLGVFVVCASLALAISLAAAGVDTASQSKLSAAAIVDKNVAARGGLQAWRAVQTLSLAGKLGAGGNRRAAVQVPVPNQKEKASRQSLPSRPTEEAQLPFVMEMKRPRKMRFELQFNGQTAIQVFDGANGWKLRPFLNRRVVEPFTTDEMKAASLQPDLDGPLVDYAAKGTQVEVACMKNTAAPEIYTLSLPDALPATAPAFRQPLA